MRLSPATLTEEPECFTVIERNLWQVNNLPSLPTRFWQKNAGPPGIFQCIRNATMGNIHQIKSSPNRDAIMSKSLLNIIFCLNHYIYKLLLWNIYLTHSFICCKENPSQCIISFFNVHSPMNTNIFYLFFYIVLCYLINR